MIILSYLIYGISRCPRCPVPLCLNSTGDGDGLPTAVWILWIRPSPGVHRCPVTITPGPLQRSLRRRHREERLQGTHEVDAAALGPVRDVARQEVLSDASGGIFEVGHFQKRWCGVVKWKMEMLRKNKTVSRHSIPSKRWTLQKNLGVSPAKNDKSRSISFHALYQYPSIQFYSSQSVKISHFFLGFIRPSCHIGWAPGPPHRSPRWRGQSPSHGPARSPLIHPRAPPQDGRPLRAPRPWPDVAGAGESYIWAGGHGEKHKFLPGFEWKIGTRFFLLPLWFCCFPGLIITPFNQWYGTGEFSCELGDESVAKEAVSMWVAFGTFYKIYKTW